MQSVIPETARGPNPGAGIRSWPRKRARFAFLLVILVTGALMCFNYEAVIQYSAEQWVVSDDIHPADAIAILGGGLNSRPFAAAEDYRNGLAPKILVANVRLNRSEALGVFPSHSAMNRAVLIRLGVPESDIETFGIEVSTTYEEAQALRDWAIRTHPASVIVPTEGFASRRVRWTLTQALAGTGTVVQLQALDRPAHYHAGWWKTDQGLIAFNNEVIKYLYYRYRY
jgi:uncharacterized SAM-binding protein YcdF (DUF218 family)